jgi:hypothetical protein
MLKRLIPIASAAALAAVIVGGISAASGSDTGSKSRDFTVIDTTVLFTDVDVDNSGSLTIGDQFVEHNILRNEALTKELGTLDAICTFTDVSEETTTVHCEATVELRKGSIEIAGLLHFADEESNIAVTGGTGRFEKAKGQVFLRAINDTDVRIRFDLE